MDPSVQEGLKNRFKNRLFGVLCEFEKNGEWEKYLDSILIELEGYEEEKRTINWYVLHSKLCTLRRLKYEYFRSTIFECMNLVERGW